MKKSGFTMIELIFVIVILGVLAAVAIPKLNATRDDAEQAKAMTNLATLMGDLTSFYTSQGEFKENISAMTNVPLTEQTGENAGKFDYMIKNERCLTFQTVGAALVVTPNKDAQQKVCKNVLTNKSTQNIIRGSYTCKTDITIAAQNKYPTGSIALNEGDTLNALDGIKVACVNVTAEQFGKPAAANVKTGEVYHNQFQTGLGLKVTTTDVTSTDNIAEFTPVVMSFEGAGVAF